MVPRRITIQLGLVALALGLMMLFLPTQAHAATHFPQHPTHTHTHALFCSLQPFGYVCLPALPEAFGNMPYDGSPWLQPDLTGYQLDTGFHSFGFPRLYGGFGSFGKYGRFHGFGFPHTFGSFRGPGNGSSGSFGSPGSSTGGGIGTGGSSGGGGQGI